MERQIMSYSKGGYLEDQAHNRSLKRNKNMYMCTKQSIDLSYGWAEEGELEEENGLSGEQQRESVPE